MTHLGFFSVQHPSVDPVDLQRRNHHPRKWSRLVSNRQVQAVFQCLHGCLDLGRNDHWSDQDFAGAHLSTGLRGIALIYGRNSAGLQISPSG